MNVQFDGILFHTGQSDELMDWMWSLGMDASGIATAASTETWYDTDLRPEMIDIGVPILICHRIHDEITLIEITGEILAEGIENAELIRLENSGHSLTADETEKLAGFAG